jgi:hypothetical protein
VFNRLLLPLGLLAKLLRSPILLLPLTFTAEGVYPPTTLWSAVKIGLNAGTADSGVTSSNLALTIEIFKDSFSWLAEIPPITFPLLSQLLTGP